MVRILFTALVLLAAVPATPVHAASEDPYDEFESGDFGRIRYEERGAVLIRSTGIPAGEEQATINSALFPGDSIRTDRDQRVEVQLAGGTLVRVDVSTDLTLQSLPDPYAEQADNSVLALAGGGIQISARLGSNEEFRVDTPGASVFLLGDGEFRIEVDDRGRTRVFSRRGVAEVVGDGGSVLFRGGMRTEIHAGSIPGEPEPFNVFATDDFDRWVEARAESYRRRDAYVESDEIEAYDEIPSEVRPYYRELSAYGRWVYVPTYGYCWYPYDTPAGWRPYRDGYWSYGSRGYLWVSSEPWGWAPYHYGRWNWVAGYGWCWAPGRVFGGAWVSWSWGSTYVGWAPLDYWNRPAHVRYVYYDYYCPSTWTFSVYANFGSGYGGRHGGGYRHPPRYSVHDVGDDLRDTAVVTRPPRISPREIAAAPSPRDRVAREYGKEPLGRVPVVRTDARPKTTFNDDENVVVARRRGGAGLTRAGGGRGSVEEKSPAAGTPRVERPRALSVGGSGRSSAASSASRKSSIPTTRQRPGSASTARQRPGSPSSEQPPATEPPPATAGGRPSSPPRGAPSTPGRSSGSEARQASPPARGAASRESDPHLRTIYRQASEPRRTEQSTGSGERRSGAGRGSSGSTREPAPSAAPPRSPQRSGSAASSSSGARSSGSSRPGTSASSSNPSSSGGSKASSGSKSSSGSKESKGSKSSESKSSKAGRSRGSGGGEKKDR